MNPIDRGNSQFDRISKASGASGEKPIVLRISPDTGLPDPEDLLKLSNVSEARDSEQIFHTEQELRSLFFPAQEAAREEKK
jgi:hypothetical protein